jgi:hypothetical protein
VEQTSKEGYLMLPAKLISLPNSSYCLISTEYDWKEGNAINLLNNELIYYNGDYGDKRSPYIKRVIAQLNEIGWVRRGDENYVAKFEDMLIIVVQELKHANGNCFVEENKIEGKYVIKLL